MQVLSSPRVLMAAALALGALTAAATAHARSDLVFSIGIHAPLGHVQPAPVYVQPAPVYVHPAPVYVQPRPVYVQPSPYHYDHRPHHHRRGPWGDADRDGIPNIHDRYPHGRHGHAFRGGWGDRDRDGVPNRYDRAPHNPHWR